MADRSYKLTLTLDNGKTIDAGTITAPQGPTGAKGTTFTPSVSEAGVLSWTNDGGLTNPASVNIKGPKGDDAVITESDVAGWGFTKNTGTITGIKMNGASKGTSGVVDLGTVLTEHQSLANYVTLNGDDQTITGVKIFTKANYFQSETLFTHTSYAPTWKDNASGVGKSSCFTRGAFDQAIVGQIIAPNQTFTDDNYSYATESGKIKFQRIVETGKNQAGTASTGQFVLEDMAVISSDGMTVGGKAVATTDQIPDISGDSGSGSDLVQIEISSVRKFSDGSFSVNVQILSGAENIQVDDRLQLCKPAWNVENLADGSKRRRKRYRATKIIYQFDENDIDGITNSNWRSFSLSFGAMDIHSDKLNWSYSQVTGTRHKSLPFMVRIQRCDDPANFGDGMYHHETVSNKCYIYSDSVNNHFTPA